jgi:hypothetical protein
MIVRIRLQCGPLIKRKRRKNQHVALALATLLNPAAVTACALALWRLAADLGTARQFAISNGLFSHWQVWVAIMGLLKLTAMLLNRYGNAEPMLQNAEHETSETLLNSGF